MNNLMKFCSVFVLMFGVLFQVNAMQVNGTSNKPTEQSGVFKVDRVFIIENYKRGRKQTEINVGNMSDETRGYLGALSCSIENIAGMGCLKNDVPQFVLEVEIQGTKFYFDLTVGGLLRENGVTNSKEAKEAVRRFFGSIKASTLCVKQIADGRNELIIP